MIREYRRDLQHSYLVMHTEEMNMEDNYVMRMITENTISGLLSCSCKRIDDIILYYYDVTSQISLKERLNHKKIHGKEMLLLLNCLVTVLNNIDEYLLPGDGICLDMDCIFVDAQMEIVKFCYFPEKDRELIKNIQELFEELLPFLDHQIPESVQLGYDIFHYLMKTPFSLDGLAEQIINMQKEDVDEMIQEEVSVKPKENAEENIEEENDLRSIFEENADKSEHSYSLGVVCGALFCLFYIFLGWYVWNNFRFYMAFWASGGIACGVIILILLSLYIKKIKKRTTESEMQKVSEIKFVKECETDQVAFCDIDIEQNMQTSILCEARTQYMYALEEKYTDLHRRFEIKDCEVQIIGRMQETADVVLDFSSVSRVHARLRKENEKFFLSDLNSRNGTWVNGKAMVGIEEVEITPGDEIRFAEGLYTFKKI